VMMKTSLVRNFNFLLKITKINLYVILLIADKGNFGPKAFIFVDNESDDEEEEENVREQDDDKLIKLLWGLTLEEEEEEDNDETASEASSDFSAMDEGTIGDILDNEDAKQSGNTYLKVLKCTYI